MKDPLEEAGAEVDRRGATRILVLLVVALVALFVLDSGARTAILLVVGIVVMVMLHEAGHYAMAKRSGMKVTEYFLGFGPRLWSFRRGETEYGVKAIPAGGYVRIVGMTNLEEGDPAQEPERPGLPRRLAPELVPVRERAGRGTAVVPRRRRHHGRHRQRFRAPVLAFGRDHVQQELHVVGAQGGHRGRPGASAVADRDRRRGQQPGGREHVGPAVAARRHQPDPRPV